MSTKLSNRTLVIIGILAVTAYYYFFSTPSNSKNIPHIAIANYGPHPSLDRPIESMQQELKRLGYVEGKNITIDIAHVNFDPTLINQMLTKLKAGKPDTMVVLATPIAQVAKNMVKNTPIVFMDITDPVEAGLLDQYDQAKGNITGVSDRQNLNTFLDFAKSILPHAKRIGLLNATGEANDQALVKMMRTAAEKHQMELVLVPIDQARDIPMRMQIFKGKVDFIYVGVSGPIQPSLPTIAAEADRMGIPIFNADKDAVYQHIVLASYGVSYTQIGINTAHMVDQILKGKKLQDISPSYANAVQHEGYISKQKAAKMGVKVPTSLSQLTIVE